MRSKRTIIYIAAIVAVLVGATVGRSLWKKYHVAPIAERYQLAEITHGDVVERIVANGTLNPVIIVNVGTQVSGTVAKLYVDYNDHVKKDQIIAELDPRVIEATVNQTRANLASAKASLGLASATLERNENLFKQDFISRQDLDQARQSREAAAAQVKSLEAKLSADLSNLSYTVIKAPVSGVVMSRAVNTGQTVAASFTTPTLFTIAEDLSKMQIESNVPEADIGVLKVGQAVNFTVDAYPNQRFIGKLRQVRINPITEQGVVTYQVIIDSENPDGKLLPGMTALVNVIVSERKDVLRAPAAALAFKPKMSADEMKEMRDRERAEAQNKNGAKGDAKPGETKSEGGEALASANAGSGAERFTPEQRARFAQRMAENGGAGGGGGNFTAEQRARFTSRRASAATLYVPDVKAKRLNAVQVRSGLSDGEYTEIIGSDLKPGDQVVVGEKNVQAAALQNNNNAFRFPGGGNNFGGGNNRGLR